MDPVTIGIGLTAAYALLKSKGGKIQQLALTTLNQALESVPIPGTLTIETILPELPAGVLKDTVSQVTANAGPLADRAAMEDEAGIPVDPSEAAAAINDIQARVEPAALVLATMIASAGPDLASTKLSQLFPVDIVPVGAMSSEEVVAILLDNLTGADLSNPKTLEASLSTGAVQSYDDHNPDGTTSHVIIRQNVDGSVQTQEIVHDETGAVIGVTVTTSSPGSAMPGALPTSGGMPVIVDSPGYVAATKMFPAWSGRFRAINGQSAPASMYPGSQSIAARTLLSIVTGA
jgi:hypothetical protein